MEELLLQLKTGFASERFNSLEEISARALMLKEYVKSLDSVMAKVDETILKYRKDLLPIVEEKRQVENELVTLKEAHLKEGNTHEQRAKERAVHLDSLEKNISDKESKHSSLDKSIDALIAEKKGHEFSANEFRAANSSLERSNRDFKKEESELKASIENKRKEDAELTSSIEEKKKEFTRLSSDVAALQARIK